MVKKLTKNRKRNTPGRTTRRTDDSTTTGGRQPRGDRAKRLLDLVMLLLRARSPVTFREIKDQFSSYQTANIEAGLRAFERDKADLLELGVPIRYITPDEDDALEEGGYVVELKRYRLPEVHLTTDEVSALVLAASVARAVPGGSTPKIVDLALKKLAFDTHEQPDTPLAFPPPASAITRREPVLVHFPENRTANAKVVSDRFAALEGATRNRKRVTLRYQSGSTGQVQLRDVDPYGLVYREGSWVLVGYCHLRKDVRNFRLDRIVNLEIAPKPKSPDFERPTDFDVRAHVSRSPWTFQTSAAEDIELEITTEAADVANEDFGPEASRREEGGSVFVSFSCGNPDYVVSRILAAKGGLLLRKGDRLRARLHEELHAIKEHYGA